MLSGKFFLSVISITVAIILIQWIFVGFLFHKYQASTPQTWRKESSRSYAMSSFLSLFFAFMFTVIISIWIRKYGAISNVQGLKFGVLCWISFAIPIELGNAIYVNYSRMFALGKCLSALVEYSIAGALASFIL